MWTVGRLGGGLGEQSYARELFRHLLAHALNSARSGDSQWRCALIVAPSVCVPLLDLVIAMAKTRSRLVLHALLKVPRSEFRSPMHMTPAALRPRHSTPARPSPHPSSHRRSRPSHPRTARRQRPLTASDLRFTGTTALPHCTSPSLPPLAPPPSSLHNSPRNLTTPPLEHRTTPAISAAHRDAAQAPAIPRPRPR